MFTPHEPPPRARDIGRIPFPRLTPWAGSAAPGSSQQATPSPLQISTPVIAGQPAQEGMHTPDACHLTQLIPVSRRLTADLMSTELTAQTKRPIHAYHAAGMDEQDFASMVCELRHRRPLFFGHQRHQDRRRKSTRCPALFLAAYQGPAPPSSRAVHRAVDKVKTPSLFS